MKSKFKNLLLIAVAMFSVFGCCFSSDPASAAFSASDCPKGSLYKTKPSEAKAAEDIKTLADCNLAANDYDLMKTATTIIDVIVGVIGIICVAVIVIGGITYATSQGDTAKTTKAKNTILYGVVGLIIALLAFAIVNFVLSGVFGGDDASDSTDESYIPAQTHDIA